MREPLPLLLLGDCVERMRELDPDSIDAVVCDPPYLIEFMGRAWDRVGDVRQPGDDNYTEGPGPYGRAKVRYGGAASYASVTDLGQKMQEWHRHWALEAYRVLKPGGHLLAFGGTRTFHRLASGIEDAGFEVRDCLAWMYASGFPKSLDVAKAIDKAQGVEGEWRQEDHPGRSGAREASAPARDGTLKIGQLNHRSDENPDGLRHVYEAATEDARRWDGWGTALKPAFEPVVVARKPLAGTVAATVLAHGTGALNIDAARIAFVSAEDEEEAKAKNAHADFGTEPGGNQVYGDFSMVDRRNYDPPGRWPANVLLGHHEDCVELGPVEVTGSGHTPASRPSSTFAANAQSAEEERSWRRETVTAYDCHADCPVRLLDEQAGSRGGGYATGGESQEGHVFAFDNDRGDEPRGYGDTGGPSRFFFCAKVGRLERNAGLDDFDETPAGWHADGAATTRLGNQQEREAGITAPEQQPRRNPHPTVKPIELMRWLLRLVTPPGGLVLDPFLGSGSTGCAAALEGLRFVGIERDPDYLAVATARIRFWAEHGDAALDTARAVERRREVEDAGQLTLLG